MKVLPALLAPLTALALSTAAALADDVKVPHEFQANTPAKAAEVNANFESIATAVNDNDTRIDTLESSTATLQTEVTAVQTGLNGKLDKSGDTMSGNLTVPKVVYSTPRSHVVCMSGDMFRPRMSTVDYSSGFGSGGARITTANSTELLASEIQLPDGATITSVTFYFYDNDAANNLKAYCTLQRFAGAYMLITPSGEEFASSGAQTAVQAVTCTPTTNTQVQNSIWALQVRVSPQTGSVWTANLLIKGVTIAYTLPEAP